MLEEFQEDEIVRKVGGRFKLSTLIQKRMVALNRGARPLVDLQTRDHLQVVVNEILTDKIYLDTSGDVQTSEEAPEGIDASITDGGPSLSDL